MPTGDSGDRAGRAEQLPAGLFPTEDEIAQLAFDLFFERGRTAWRLADCWRLAESELLERAARRAVPPVRRRSPR